MPSEMVETEPTQRGRHLRFIIEHERMGWQKASRYDEYAQTEAAISRHKRVSGDRARSCTDRRQAAKVDVASHALNGMLELGPPTCVRLV